MRYAGFFMVWLGAATLGALSQAGSATSGSAPLAALSFLVGRWTASGAGDPGRSTGEFSFEWAADRHALLRFNEAITQDGRHTDVMLVYAQADGSVHALYTDSEGHDIAYDATVSSDARRVVFESKAPGPRYRLWYQLKPDRSLSTGFQVAPPGSPDFATYLEGTAQRK